MLSKCFCREKNRDPSPVDDCYSEATTVEVTDGQYLNDSIPLNEFSNIPIRKGAKKLPRGQAREGGVSRSAAKAAKKDKGKKKKRCPSHDSVDTSEDVSNATSGQSSGKFSEDKAVQSCVKGESEESSISLEDLLKIISHETVEDNCPPTDYTSPIVEIRSDIEVLFSTDKKMIQKKQRGFVEKDHDMKMMVHESISAIAGTSSGTLSSFEREEILKKESQKGGNVAIGRNISSGSTLQEIDLIRRGEKEYKKSSTNLEKQVTKQIYEESATSPNGQVKLDCFGAGSKEVEYPESEKLDSSRNVSKQTSPNVMLKENELKTCIMDGEVKAGNESMRNIEGVIEGQKKECNRDSSETLSGRKSSDACSGAGWYWKNIKMFLTGKKPPTTSDNSYNALLSQHFLFKDQNESSLLQKLSMETNSSLLETELYGYPKGSVKKTITRRKCYAVNSPKIQNQMFKKKMDHVMLHSSYKMRPKNKKKNNVTQNKPKEREVLETSESKEALTTKCTEATVSIAGPSSAMDTVETQAQKKIGSLNTAKVSEVRDWRLTGAIPKKRPASKEFKAVLAAQSSDDDDGYMKKDSHLKVRDGGRSMGRMLQGPRPGIVEPYHAFPAQPLSIVELPNPSDPSGEESSQSKVSLDLGEWLLPRGQMEGLQQFGSSTPWHRISSQTRRKVAPPLPPRPLPWLPRSRHQLPVPSNTRNKSLPGNSKSKQHEVSFNYQDLELSPTFNSSFHRKCSSWLEENSNYFYEVDDFKNDYITSPKRKRRYCQKTEVGSSQLVETHIPSPNVIPELPKTSGPSNLVSSDKTFPNNPLVESHEAKVLSRCKELSLNTPEHFVVLLLEYRVAPVVNCSQNSACLPSPSFQPILVPTKKFRAVKSASSSDIPQMTTKNSVPDTRRADAKIFKKSRKMRSRDNRISDTEGNIKYGNKRSEKLCTSSLTIHPSYDTQDHSLSAVACQRESSSYKMDRVVGSQSHHDVLPPASVPGASLSPPKPPPKPPRLIPTQSAFRKPYPSVTSKTAEETSLYLLSLLNDPQSTPIPTNKLKKCNDTSRVPGRMCVGSSSKSSQNVPRGLRGQDFIKNAHAVQKDIEYFI